MASEIYARYESPQAVEGHARCLKCEHPREDKIVIASELFFSNSCFVVLSYKPLSSIFSILQYNFSSSLYQNIHVAMDSHHGARGVIPYPPDSVLEAQPRPGHPSADDGASDDGASVSSDTGDTVEVKGPGLECEIKNLYQKEDSRGRTSWVETYPDDLDEAAENEHTALYAILVRNKKSFDSRKKLQIHSIDVQSPLLRKFLSKVLGDYPGNY